MDRKSLIIDGRSNWEVVEHFHEVAPNAWTAILRVAFRVKTVNLCGLSLFMIASQKSNSVRVSDFEQQ